jgi:hypothetical protein
LTKEGKQALAVERYVSNLPDAISAGTHRMRMQVVRWVLCPTLIAIVLTCLSLLVLDALGRIPPMRNALLASITTVLTSSVITTALSAGFGWLFTREPEVPDTALA